MADVSAVCIGEYVGLEESDDGIWNVYFGPLKLGPAARATPADRRRVRETPSPNRVTHVLGLFCHLCPRPLTATPIVGLPFASRQREECATTLA